MKLEKPIYVQRHMQYIEKTNHAICDGMIEPMGVELILYFLFIISGITIFIYLMNKYIYVRENIKDDDDGKRKT